MVREEGRNEINEDMILQFVNLIISARQSKIRGADGRTVAAV